MFSRRPVLPSTWKTHSPSRINLARRCATTRLQVRLSVLLCASGAEKGGVSIVTMFDQPETRWGDGLVPHVCAARVTPHRAGERHRTWGAGLGLALLGQTAGTVGERVSQGPASCNMALACGRGSRGKQPCFAQRLLSHEVKAKRHSTHDAALAGFFSSCVCLLLSVPYLTRLLLRRLGSPRLSAVGTSPD